MAATWICEKCGRANLGDLCPGCAEPRPIRVRSAYGSEKNREIFDGVSEPIRSPFGPAAKLLSVALLIFMVSTNAPLWRVTGFCLIGLAGLLAVRPWTIDPAWKLIATLIWRRPKNRGIEESKIE
jgi:hypothetical protein